MQTLTAKQLMDKITRREDFVLINVLPETSFDEEHIPGSLNVPHEKDGFVEVVRSLAGRKDRTIVVYCASKDCTASPTAAKKLERAGFTDVWDFEDGMAGWRLAGFQIASTAGTAA